MKYDFIDFINNPDKYSTRKFIDNNEQTLKVLNKIKLIKYLNKKKNLSFDNNFYDKIYNHAFIPPTIKQIMKNKNRTYIIPGGIRAAGARYPDYIITYKDIEYFKEILIKLDILNMPIEKLNIVIEKCIEFIQTRLNTNLFNNTNSKWSILDSMVSGFSNLCLNISNFNNKKGVFMPTNLSMLLYLFGDCREHCLLLTYLLNIYLYYNNNKNYLVYPIYIMGGINIDTLNNEHTFPILIDILKKKIICIDALHHKSKIVKNPKYENNNFEIKLFKENIYIGGIYLNENKDYLIKFVNWFSNIKPEYSISKLLNDNYYVYGINFDLPSIENIFDNCFNKKIIKHLLNSQLCRKKDDNIKCNN
jgi:hypothetical protein